MTDEQEKPEKKVTWKKVPRAPYYLEIWAGPYRTSYRVNFRGEGINLRKTLEPPTPPGHFETWKRALVEADRLIAEARFGNKATPKELVRNEDIIQQLLSESETNDDLATRQIKRNIFLKHLLPWLNEHFPYAATLTVATWPAYKKFKREERATIALENHYKYFAMLAKRVWELGLIPTKLSVRFNVKKEDFRATGLVIPNDHFALMLAAATPKHFMKLPKAMLPKWRDRMVLQRRTGVRPGEGRELEKSRVTRGVGYAVIDIPAEKSKTHIGRKFKVRDPDVLELIDRRLDLVDGPYFFPSEKRSDRPMDKGLNGWYGMLERAFDPEKKGLLLPEYTPHDLRHTYATEMFKKTNKYAQLCYQLNMSLEMAQEVYIHLNENDTEDLADLAAEHEGAAARSEGGK